jgi:hypothetical protein
MQFGFREGVNFLRWGIDYLIFWEEWSYRGIVYQKEMLLFSTKTYSLNLFDFRFERFGF